MDNGDLVEDIENLSPDLILLGGDLVKDTENSYDNMISLCRQLSELAPVCGVLGNHEDVKIYHQGDEKLVKRKSCGTRKRPIPCMTIRSV